MQFKVEANSFGAEFGHANGGVVNAVTRSGSNQFRGNVYEFLRNDKLDAKGSRMVIRNLEALPKLGKS